MSVIKPYDEAYYSMTWMGPKGYPEQGNSGRCYFTGLLGMFRLHGESDVLFADGTSGDGFSFRWSPVWGALGNLEHATFSASERDRYCLR